MGPRRITREEIIDFAAQFDPQPMHLDEVAAAKTMLGGLGASGWHTCAIMMKMIADGLLLDTASMGAPGIDEVKWMRPVRPGDSLTVRGSVLSARVSQSRKDRGFVTFHWDVSNDRGERVMTLDLSADAVAAKRGRRRMRYFDDIKVGDRADARQPHVHRRGHQVVRGAIRSAGIPHGRGGGGEVALRCAVRVGLAHGGERGCGCASSISSARTPSAPRVAKSSRSSDHRRASAN